MLMSFGMKVLVSLRTPSPVPRRRAFRFKKCTSSEQGSEATGGPFAKLVPTSRELNNSLMKLSIKTRAPMTRWQVVWIDAKRHERAKAAAATRAAQVANAAQAPRAPTGPAAAGAAAGHAAAGVAAIGARTNGY
ncbi:unnamed protein product [Prorocentrum cordatum]|uniref:Uncharacterized protein n=1 Tax=Prorocentrum cordatum TaxID=2364126 RepID=A0ABN9P648_9DINO|nr:unnamed protein product [Polarella glacialis]